MTSRLDRALCPFSINFGAYRALQLLLLAILAIVLAACQPAVTVTPAEQAATLPTADVHTTTTAMAAVAAGTANAHATATSVVRTRIAEGVATAVRATLDAQVTATSAHATAAANATATERARPTATPTPTATATPTRVATRRPTVPPPPSATPTPLVARYYQSSCASYQIATFSQTTTGWAMLTWCLAYVELHPDSMEFHTTWEVTELHGMEGFWKHGDNYLDDIYVEDQFGTRYAFFQLNGGAEGGYWVAHGLYEGSYFFPLPTNGAKNFGFWDRGQHGVVLYATLP